MTRSEDRWVYPVEGEDPRAYDDAHRLAANVGHRQISHDQGAERHQGLSSDKPGIDLSEREAVDYVEAEPPYAEDPGSMRDPLDLETGQDYAEDTGPMFESAEPGESVETDAADRGPTPGT